MKITNFIMVFLIFIIPFNLITYIKLGDMKSVSIRNLELNRILDTSVQDGVASLVEVGENRRVIINKEKGVQAFFNTLYINFDVLDNPVLQRKINGYVPAIVIVDYDGYYVLSQDIYTNSAGYQEVKLVWKPKKSYAYSEGDFSYAFTLDNMVTVYDSGADKFFKGDYHDLKFQVADNVLQADTSFDQIRRRTIVECIKNDMNYYINKHNEVARKYGITYQFTMPTIENEDWYKTINDIGMLVFFQGIPLNTSGESYNTFALGGARIVRANLYFGETDAGNGIKFYHKEDCPLLTVKDITYFTRKECAENGYLPCKVCKP